MNDEFAGPGRITPGRVIPGRITGEGIGNKASRVQGAMTEARDAADQFSGVVRARPLAAAAIALSVSYRFGPQR